MVGLALVRTDIFDLLSAMILLAACIVLLLLRRAWLLALMLLLGVLWGVGNLWHAAARVSVDPSWLKQTVVITADIDKVESFAGYRRFHVDHVHRADGAWLPGKALLYQHGRKKHSIRLQAGQRIQVAVHWREPRNYQNPGGFDYRAWCFDRGIALLGSMKDAPKILQTNISWLDLARERVRHAIMLSGVGADARGVLLAVLLGERAQLTAHSNRIFSATGAAHLLAISGMHIGMAATWVFALIWFLLTRREAWIIRFPVRNIALIGGFLAAMAYATLAGWPVPAIRATFMLGAAALAWCMASRSEPLNTLLAALGLILCVDPAAIVSLSLWLSFLATASLLLWVGTVQHKATASSIQSVSRQPAWQITLRNAVKRLMHASKVLIWISLLATLATLPCIVAVFGRIPVYSLPANLLMVPLYAGLVMPAALLGEVLALAGMDGFAGMLMQAAAWGIGVGQDGLTMLANLPAGQQWAVHPPLWVGGLYMLGMGFSGVWLLKKAYGRACVSAVLVMIVYLGFVLPEDSVAQPQWIIWDVGQGAASSLVLPDHRVLVADVPGRRGSRFNGGTTVAQGLRYLGLTHVDVLALSHAQSDHLGGALSLLQHVNHVGEVWLPDVPSARSDDRVKAVIEYARSHGTSIRWLAQGDRMDLGRGNGVAVLWPPRGFDPSNANNTSLTLAIRLANQTRLLLPGDIEAEAEIAMLADGMPRADIMLMPHHGSNTSSQPVFIRSLQPKLAIAQAGFANRYGFPKAAVVERYKRSGADVRNTMHGAVLVNWPEKTADFRVESWHQSAPSRRTLALRYYQSLQTAWF